ncbi:lipid II:glycine glycyltransferase FemX [Jonesia denitrificans]|uniref:BioF2-like acetyltransferase domain-containing protein n=1 Tax=Jonesia denitrificans (strain ATCC 14870 / DSM 20603 / BCRC 15368 / CIP 55.134 / JCM 11481 / NBRC 15587 / NCTC 10816 / Prevot 55134) TaxID=471856 RepID=C7R4I9_JONDD|nr:GNAT family N-acetyltransferase [Jonesia denitrificans]ACV09046.1 hypothetical protein Jden_1393 [Jonesia denitrificans DSM 20603]ASE09660.1 peptidoglycan bridge formation glycyltransferase FemA/FemB family protein [Jonesia denitrificans]QXB44199.1 peptidoglycan bridge formation glycyltransferase FemA/FemB family protein [Jonesia denitrificans]SQH21191.1 Uncharacterized protein involved in methicillin resistance [Jonesia denitrificans]
MYTVTPISDHTTWDTLVDLLAGHPLQKWGWGQLKSAHNWSATRLLVTNAAGDRVAGAQVLHRHLPFPFQSVSHMPRGPFFSTALTSTERTDVTTALTTWLKEHTGGVGVTIEPDLDATEPLTPAGAVASPNPILYPTTLILDLTQPADDILAGASKTTRYDIRKGAKNNLDIRRVVTDSEVDAVLATYRANAERVGFAIHSDEYYRDVHRLLGEDSFIAACFADGEVVSFVWLAKSATTWFELYASATDQGRKLRANAPVKWFAIEQAHTQGATRYDMNGLLNDGISDFKRSFAKHENTLHPSIDVPFSSLYTAWNKALPTAKKVLRKIRG